MRAQAFTNTFSGGMVGDIDAHEQPNNTYRYAYGGRIIFNESDDVRNSLDENSKSGSTRAFANIKGNKFALSLCEGYQFIGSAETDNGAVIFSTNETYGEIGFLEINDNVNKTGFAKYTTLFNDRNDPNGDRLNFSVDHYITNAEYLNENQFIERVYFTDGYNQKRVINLKLFYDSQGNPYHHQDNPCTAPATYPKYLSVHAFDERMDLFFPRIKFASRIIGQLKSGQYQLVIKYVSKSGHSSVWSPISRPVFVTDQKIDGSITVNSVDYPNAYKSNHHNRSMGASNKVTEEGLAWDLEGIDTRWDQIKVGYIYHISNDAAPDINEFKIYDITTPNLTVNLNTHTGLSIPKAEITQRFETQLSVGTTAQQENRIWDGDIELLPDMEFDLSTVSIKPKVRYYRPDNTSEPTFDPVFNPVTNRDDNDPLTNTATKTGVVSISSYNGNSENHKIIDDYENYKGQQFNHLFKGYFRGETQPFGFLLRDRKGNPLFVGHIKDFTFPEQFDTKDENGNATDWTLSRRNSDGSYDLRIMGAMFSNLRIPANILFDKFGKLNVSSFEIVRTARIPRIANQGLMFNCNISPNGKTDNEDDGLIHPMEFWDNTYSIKPVGSVGSLPGSHVYYGILGSYYRVDKNPKFVGNAYSAYSASGFFNYHSPDIMIERALGNPDTPNQQMVSGQMQKVGFVNKSASTEQIVLFDKHTYRKCYDTKILTGTTEVERIRNGRAKIGSLSRIKQATLHDKASIYVYEKFDPETAGQLDYRVHVQAFFPGGGQEYARKSTQQPYSVIMKLLDWKLVDSIESPTSRCSYPIVNWKVTPTTNYGETEDENDSESALNTRIYFSTGHFQPITLNVLNGAAKTYNTDGTIKEYIFNDIEVWGGDCYVNLWDFTRMYPEYSNCEKSGGYYPDYSDSLICPIESKYNLALLFGRRFAANTVLPQQVSCEATPIAENMLNGIAPRQPEGFDYNKVLLLEESIGFYFPKPANDINLVSKQESSIRWSPQKIYGELEDVYRQKLVSDYKDVDGSFGRIQKLVTGFDYLYVVQERAFGACLTRSDRFISTDAGQISVTSGDAIGGIRYISKVYGSQHRNSISSHDNKIIFTDAHMGKILLFSQSGLIPESEADLMNDPIAMKSIYMDQPIKHKDGFVDIISGIDRENGDFLTTFLYENGVSDNIPGNADKSDEMKSFTIAYNGKIGKWNYFHPFTPHNYFNVKRYLFSTNPQIGTRNQVFLHDHGKYGQWCGIYYPTILEFIVNPSASVAKVFDNGFINVNEDSYLRISKVICSVNKNVHTLSLSRVVNNQVVQNYEQADFMEDSLRFPIFENDDAFDEEKERLRGHYLKVRIEIENGQQDFDSIDKHVVISSFDTRFRLSSPMQFQ